MSFACTHAVLALSHLATRVPLACCCYVRTLTRAVGHHSWHMHTDNWCYADTSDFRYHLDTMVFQHRTNHTCTMYDIETDQFVQGTLETCGEEMRFVKS
jgi:hypothetical protein